MAETPERKWDGMWFENKDRFEIRRYKCWVLAQVPRASVDKFVTATLRMLQNEVGLAQLKATVNSNSDALEVQALRERIHYGRLFRLTTEERWLRNCPETPTP